jgi:glyoxylase-like metal-dependent hydrolase (beta-lactamase superfamily II)/ferredoxin
MADPRQRRPHNVPGEFYVDATCIDCDACRWIAEQTFDSEGDQSRVFHQPGDAAELLRAQMALIACPTASIGTTGKQDLAAAVAAFPDPIEGEVFHCGYHHKDSFGAAAYLIVREAGNVLVDSPRFAAHLVRRIEELGGVRTMFLTHRDDVADHAKWHERFGCERVLHARDVTADTAEVEVRIDGDDAVTLASDLSVIPTPGHTEGSACLLYRDRFLFSGDHLAWSPGRRAVTAFRDACWYDWHVQTGSVERLLSHRFEWLLPGHGRRVHLDAAAMQEQVRRCVEWMQQR